MLLTPVKAQAVDEGNTYLEKQLLVTTIITPEEPVIKLYKLNPDTSDVKIIGVSHDQCVIWARTQTGNEKVKGYAGNLQPEGTEPRIGAIALERTRGHVSVVTDVLPDGRLVLMDANWIKGHITQRIVEPSQERGYIY